MACNSNDRRQRRKQRVAVGAAASKTQVPPKARCECWVPQPELVSEEKAVSRSMGRCSLPARPQCV